MYWVDVISDVLLDANISTQINPNDVITAATLDTRCSAGGSSSSEATTSMPATTNMKVLPDLFLTSCSIIYLFRLLEIVCIS